MPQRAVLTLPLVRAFDAVAEHASLTRAARILRRSQPALTISLSKLEEMLGATLIERGRSGAHLTAAGEILARRTRRMFNQLERLARDHPAAGGAAHWTANLTHAQAKCFASLADHDTVERAAAALMITPSSLRRTAQSLEDLIGKPLLMPTAQGMAPTKLGAGIARRMKLALGELEAGVEEIEIAAGRIRTRIAIGVVPLSATRLLTRTINAFLLDYPEASVSIAHGAYEPLLDDLRSGRLDLLYGVLRLPPGITDVSEEPLFFDPYIVAVRRGHPLTRSRKPDLSDLLRYDWIAPRRGTPRRENIQRLFEQCGRQPKVAIETSSLNVLRSLLESSDRITLLTREEMGTSSTQDALVALKFEPSVNRGHDGIATRKSWQATPVQARFVELLREHCREGSRRKVID